MREAFDSYVYPDDTQAFAGYADTFGNDVAHSIKRQYVFPDKHNPVLRLSSLGKTAAFELVAKKIEAIPQSGKHTVSEQHRMLFSFGDYVESWLAFTFKRIGYTITESQTHVTWQGVGGHIDFLIHDEQGKPHLVECKSANDYYFTDVKKRGVGNERGYLTQLLCYHECMSEKYPDLQSHWVFINKNTSELCVIDLESIPAKTRQEALKRASSIVKAYNKVETLDDIYKFTQPPPPSIEKTRDGQLKYWDDGTPKMYAPHTVSHPEFCYICETRKTEYGKPRLYVFDYNYPEHLQKHKPDIVKQALEYA
jgi:hypothetical protein